MHDLLLIIIIFPLRFNEKPLKGIRYLQAKGLVGETPTDVAKFLYTDARLDKVECFLYVDIFIVLRPG